jgi:hypothetical protein
MKVKEMVEFSKLPTFWKTICERMTGNVVVSGIAAVMYVVLSEAEKYVLYGESVGTTERITLYPMYRKNRGGYKGLQLCKGLIICFAFQNVYFKLILRNVKTFVLRNQGNHHC